MTAVTATRNVATRREAPAKVTGQARYSAEHPLEDLVYAWPVTATIAKGSVRAVDATDALALPGVLAVLSADDTPRLAPIGDPELELFQTRDVAYRGQFVAGVVATTLEVARQAAELVRCDYAVVPHDVTLRVDHPGLYAPDHVNPTYATDSVVGDVDGALASAAVRIDATYTTPGQHNNPMEPHATVAAWAGDHLTVIDSNQSLTRVRAALAGLFGLDPAAVRVVTEHVGGGFGSKGFPRANVVLAALAARVVGRPVKCVLTRQHMFAVVGHRTPSIQRIRLGADADGRLVAIAHEVFEQSSTVKEFAEQTAVATRHMYAAPNRRTTHRLVRLDVPTPSWVRAPGECPGMFALESALDELAVACAVDPVELRIRNAPSVHPETGRNFSSHNLVACLREGATRFGWDGRGGDPGRRRRGRWMIGTGVAASTYPARVMPSRATASVGADGRYRVEIAAVDLGTGARTALALVAAEALGVVDDLVDVRIGDTDFPEAMSAGGSMGTSSWGWAVAMACERLRSTLERDHGGVVPSVGLSASADTRDAVAGLPDLARYSFGAQFAEVWVDVDTCEVRVPRMAGVFAAGRIVNAVTARSQFIGGMTMGVSMALFEESAIDPAFGDYPNHDLASYHVATCADVQDIEVAWIEEDEPTLGPLGIKGIGEIGIVGTAAAIANAVHNATGVRVRDLPITVSRLFDHASRG
ncbi:MAG TPA: xanthine dehydrogenase family protein molybdopterin-binding subunit [Acidimicrobiales bacterium]|nr:xanthine dehydrogenase family protein molybdopterin-binding subunit [Acidimicrobiales bacterium]